MNRIKNNVMFFLLSFQIIAFSEQNYDICQKNIDFKQWNKALTNCLNELSDDKSNHNDLSLLVNLAKIFAHFDNTKKELFYLDAIKSHPDYLTNFNHRHFWNRRKGQLAFFDTHYQEVDTYFAKALEIAIEDNNNSLQSISYNDLGVLYNTTGDYLLALDNYQKSLQIKLKTSDNYSIANTYSNIGSLLLEIEKPIDSIDYLLQAINYYQMVKNDKSNKMVFHVYEELSMAYLKAGQEKKAELYINKLLASNKLRTTVEEKSNASLALARYYTEENKPEIAKALLKQALYQAKPMYFLETSLELAKIELQLDNTTDAKNIALKGLKNAQDKGDIFYQFNFNNILSQSMQSANPQVALTYLKAHNKQRENFLKMKYDSKVDTVEYQIKKQMIENNLLQEQLINSLKQKKITTLTNWILLGCIILLITFITWALYFYKKKKEKNTFLEQIKYHKDQINLLNASKNQIAQDQKVTALITKNHFKKALVKAMVEATDVWNRHTGKNRIDLAEKSKVWTVTIDNGTLRTRSMDKYLSLKHIPANPRWRKVVRTIHFILSDSQLQTIDRDLLNANLKAIMDAIKKR